MGVPGTEDAGVAQTRGGVGGADLVQGADAVGVGGVQHRAGGRRGGGVGRRTGAGVGRAQHQASLVQIAARTGRQELGGPLEADGAGATLRGARLSPRPRPPLPQLLLPPLAGRRRRRRRPRARCRAVLARHRAGRPPAHRASEQAASERRATNSRHPPAPGAAGNRREPPRHKPRPEARPAPGAER